MPNDLNNVLNHLNRLIEGGMEFPDAIWRVTRNFSLNEEEVSEITQMYDEQ